MKLNRQWTIIDRIEQVSLDSSNDYLLVGGSPEGSSLPFPLCNLLPNQAYNIQIFDQLQKAPITGRSVTVSFFFGDPFLQVQKICQFFHRGLFSRVAAFPSIGQYGAEFSELLGKVELGLAREINALHQLKSEGISIAVTVSNAASIAAFARVSPDTVFVAPDFDMLETENGLSLRLLDAVQAVRAEASSIGLQPEIVLVSGEEITPQQATEAGASSVVTYSWARADKP